METKKRRDVERLRRRILKFGGKTLEKGWYSEKNLDVETFQLLLKKGDLFRAASYVRREMTARECHRNVSEFAKRNPERYRACTGFALTPMQSRWILHSWIYDCLECRLIETTLGTGSLRPLYWGAVIP